MKELSTNIKKPSAMIQTSVKGLSLIQRKIVNYLIYIAQNEGDKKFYSTKVADLKKLCNIGKNDNIDLREHFEELNDIKITFNYLSKENDTIWERMSLVAAARIAINSGVVQFEIPNMLKEKILNPNMYAPLRILLIAGLKSKYSIILYELLRDYLNSPAFPKLTIQQLRDLFGLEDGEYKLFQDFKKRVLDRSVKEVNEKTDIECSYKLFKSVRNQYSHIVFQMATNEKEKEPGQLTFDDYPKTIKGLRWEASKCYNTYGNFGNCASTFDIAQSERMTKACYWCKKFELQRDFGVPQATAKSESDEN